MDKLGLDLSLLSRFVLTCQSRRLADAAAELNHTPGALSMGLHRLEERLAMKLFDRRGSGLQLRPSAFWLFRTVCHLLYLEQHAREARLASDEKLRHLSVELDLDFAMGLVSKALVRTCQDLIALHPELLVDWRFAGLDAEAMGSSAGPTSSEMRPERAATARIFYGPPSASDAENALLLHEDAWVVVAGKGNIELSAASDRLTLLRMRPELTFAITAHAEQHGFAARLWSLDREPAQLSDVLLETPQLRLLLPASLLPHRLGLFQLHSAPLDPPLVSRLYGQAAGGQDHWTRAFLTTMRAHMATEDKIVFTPRLTMRQVHYFNLAVQTGSISGAARAANTAQSSVSKNIAQLEEIMQTPLLNRTEEGSAVSSAGAGLRPFIAGIEERQDWIIRKAHDIAAHSEARVTIGTLPSSGHDSALTEKIADVVTRIHRRHPDWQLQIVENSNTVLHERVRSGELNLAVVGMVNAQVARIRLGPSEPLSVIGNPSINFGGRKVLGLEDVCALPLVLGRQHLSIHQSFAEAARERSLNLRTAVEVGSLALAIAMVRQAPLCTILPASSVRQDIDAGNLIAIPIREEELSGVLSIIFSAERELSEAERTIVQEFVRVFRPGREAGDPIELVGMA